MFEHLELCSAAGRRMLLEQEMLTDPIAIEESLLQLDAAVAIIKDTYLQNAVGEFRHVLFQLHDIQGTLANLSKADILDDIGLFEIKNFCLLNEEARIHLAKTGFKLFLLPDLSEAISLLDPDNQRLPQFYIYPAYSEELTTLRKRQQALLISDPEQAGALRLEYLLLEDKIRQLLSVQLFDYASDLKLAHKRLALLDILFAKALQAVNLNLCRPQIVNRDTSYHGIFNPYLKNKLEQEQKSFQPVDISIGTLPGLITGANMAGKTILLKTVALAQYLLQFGFYVPADSASIVPVEEILFSMGDEQSDYNGLSSFAAEMLKINDILISARSGRKILALIDEPARTTNPDEGRAIVNALTAVLASLGVRSLITTHYSNITAPCHKLRVKGLVTGSNTVRLTIENINDYMDYTLIEHVSDDVPLDALRIASILGIDDELIGKAGEYMKQS
jgi:hypothetical protein